ncbi:Pleckstrin proteiny (PH) domain-containing protein [Trifolium repens]|nr:Pleckstrin proteiny (PH) domain-containing protein [Trifolium repens]
MLKLFALRGLPWSPSNGSREKVELTAAELEALRSELADLEEKEAQLKAQLENIDEILRSARLSGYLYIRTRWAALPGEPLPIDDTDVDDWLPRFVVLQGECLFLYLLCTDLSPQDSTLLSDIVEVNQLPSFTREDSEMKYAFCILTRHGLRYECSSSSKIQVDSWLSALQSYCKLESDTSCPNDLENDCEHEDDVDRSWKSTWKLGPPEQKSSQSKSTITAATEVVPIELDLNQT